MNNLEFEKLITNIPNFPKEGVTFKDFSPLLRYKLKEVTEEMGKDIDWSTVDIVLGVESRGFILGSTLALMNNKGFLPVRKKGKLPPPIIGEDYALEYGTDSLEMAVNSERLNVIIVDDVLATGGTLKAVLKLCERNNYQVKAVSMLINLKFLNNLHNQYPFIKSVLNYD